MLILAHVSPPEIVHGLRSFDVCMLVYASGITLKCQKYTLKTYLEYLWHRVKRRIIPSYVFIVIYAVICTLVGTIWNENWLNPISYYFKSFSLIGGGIGYLWIMAVYFLLAIVSPLIGWISGFTAVQNYKYPPQALYLLYGILVSAVIYQLSEMYLSPKLKKDNFCHFRRIISWFSVNSLDIYFAHIIVLKICGNDGLNIQNWGLKYIIVVSCSALLVLLMNIVKSRKC